MIYVLEFYLETSSWYNRHWYSTHSCTFQLPQVWEFVYAARNFRSSISVHLRH